MATIRITDLTLSAIIGTNAWERTRRQRVVINIVFSYNSNDAIRTDAIKHAVDYKTDRINHIVASDASCYFR